MCTASSAKRNSREHFSRIFVLTFSLPMLRSLSSDLVRSLIPSGRKACFSRMAKKIPNKVRARTHPLAPLLRYTSNVEAIRSSAIKHYSVFHMTMNIYDDTEAGLRGQPIFERILQLKSPSLLARSIKGLGEVNECVVQWLSLFPTFFLSDGEYCVNFISFGTETTQLQLTHALLTPRCNGHTDNSDSRLTKRKNNCRRLTEISSGYYGFSVKRTIPRGPYSVRY